MRFPPRRRPDDQELDDEIEAHLAIEAKERIDAGESPEQAERAARRAFGSISWVKDATRDAWRRGWLDSLAQDLRYALRVMRRSPGFTLVAILTLALGIGANTAIFAVVDAALLRPLPFPDSDRLVRIWSTRNGVSIGSPSPMDMRDFAAAARGFEGMVAYDHWRKNVGGIGGATEPEETPVGLVPSAYFGLLRISPILGRVFTDDENVFGKHYVAVIGEALWRTRFAADPQILGKTLRINDETYAIVGVVPNIVPAWMDQTSAPISIWTPFASADFWTETNRGRGRDDSGLGRLKPGVSYEEARADLAVVAARLARDHPVDRGIGVAIQPLADTRAGPVRPILFTLCGAVALVLLIACANLAGLLVARNSARAREFGVRVALGAGTSRLVRQLLVETLALSLGGGLAGVGLAWAASMALARIKSASNLPYISASNALPQFWSAGLDWRVLAFAGCVSLVTALLFGLAPAFTATRALIVVSLREGGRSGTVASARQRFRRLLVITEVAFSLVLVFAAALLTQTITRLGQRDPGFRPDHLLLAHIYIPPARYADADALTRFCDAFGERLRGIPGVLDASLTTGYPPSLPWRQMFTIPGLPISRTEDVPITRFAAADTRYLRTLRLRVLSGRDLADTDTATSPPVAVINEAFARRYFGNEDPVGRAIRPGPPPDIPSTPLENFGSSSSDITIVGVVRDFMNDGPARPPAPQIVTLFRQFPGINFGFKDIVVRTSTDPASVVPAVERALKSLDPEIPLGEIRTMDAHMSSQIADTRFTTLLLMLFAALGIALALIGTYGVVAYLVAQRTPELGVRVALGARAGDILWLVLRYGLSTGLAGVALGLGGTMLVRQSMAGLLYGVTPSDPFTLIGAAVALLLVVVAASGVPALRAMRIDPVRALRAE
jgi:predicted permease